MRKTVIGLFILLLASICISCSSSIASTSLSTPTQSMSIIQSDTPSPAPAITEYSEPEIEEPVETPDITPTPGVWMADTYYGVNGAYDEYDSEKDVFYKAKNCDVLWDSSYQPAIKYDAGFSTYKPKETYKIKNWEYYLFESDADDSLEYPILRKDSKGKVESLGISGFRIIAAGDYLYVYTNLIYGDFGHWDVWRVNPDGTQRKFVGNDISLFMPDTGTYMYFSIRDFYIYRTDFSFSKVESVFPDYPDIDTIDRAIDKWDGGPVLFRIEFGKIINGWIDFQISAMCIDGSSYDGGYRMLLNGSKTEKTDQGRFHIPFQ